MPNRWAGQPRADHSHPVRRAPRAVGRVLPLRHDALKAHLASVREHERAVLLVEVLIEAKPGRRASEQAGTARTTPRFGRRIPYGGTCRSLGPLRSRAREQRSNERFLSPPLEGSFGWFHEALVFEASLRSLSP